MVNSLASPRIKRSDILLGLVVLVAVILSAALFLGQLPAFPNSPNGPNASSLQIVDLAQDADLGTLIAYVENIGVENVTFNSDYSFSVNDIKIPLVEGSVDKNVLEQGQIATVDIPFKITSGIPLVVKILGNDGVLDEKTISDPDALESAFTLSVNILGNSANNVTKIPDQLSYPSGTSVTLTAESTEDWHFSDWNGDISSSDNPLVIVVDSNKILNANFIEDEVQIIFTQVGLDTSVTGTILTIGNTAKSFNDFPIILNVSKNSLLNYDFSELITSSNPGVRFKLGSVSGPDSPISITSELVIVANFESEFEVLFSTNPDNADISIQPNGNQWFIAGQEVVISTDVSSSNLVFSHWETSNQANQIEDINSQNTNVNINGPGNITAIYDTPLFQVSFEQSGIDNREISTSVLYRIDGGPLQESTVPFSVMVELDSIIEYSYQDVIPIDSESRYKLASVSEDEILTITGDVDIVGSYNIQYFLEVNSPVGNPSGEGWYDDGATASSSVASPILVTGPPKIVYTAAGWVGTGSAPNGDTTTAEFVIDEPSSIAWMWNGILTLYPDGSIVEGIPDSFGSENHWECVSDPGNPDTTYVNGTDGDNSYYVDVYSIQNVGSISDSIDKITVFADFESTFESTYARSYVSLGESLVQSTRYRLTQDWTTYSQTFSRPGGGTWTWVDINNLYCGIGFQLDGNDSAKCTLVWVEVEFTV